MKVLINFIIICLVNILYLKSNEINNTDYLRSTKLKVLPINNTKLLDLLKKYQGEIIEYTDFNTSKHVFIMGEYHNRKVAKRIIPIIKYLLKEYNIKAIGLEGKYGLKKLKKQSEIVTNLKSTKQDKKQLKEFCKNYDQSFISKTSYYYLYKLECEKSDRYQELYKLKNIHMFGLESSSEFVVLSDNNELEREMLLDQLISLVNSLDDKKIQEKLKDQKFIQYLSLVDKKFYEEFNKETLYPLHKISAYEVIIALSNFDHKLYNKYLNYFKNKSNMFPFSSNHEYIYNVNDFKKFKKRTIMKNNFFNGAYHRLVVVQLRNYYFVENIKEIYRILGNFPILIVIGSSHIKGVSRLLIDANIGYTVINFPK